MNVRYDAMGTRLTKSLSLYAERWRGVTASSEQVYVPITPHGLTFLNTEENHELGKPEQSACATQLFPTDSVSPAGTRSALGRGRKVTPPVIVRSPYPDRSFPRHFVSVAAARNNTARRRAPGSSLRKLRQRSRLPAAAKTHHRQTAAA